MLRIQLHSLLLMMMMIMMMMMMTSHGLTLPSSDPTAEHSRPPSPITITGLIQIYRLQFFITINLHDSTKPKMLYRLQIQ